MNIARTEVVHSACLVNHIKVITLVCLLGFSICREDACGLITEEHANRIANGSDDVLVAIDGRGEISVRKLRHLVLVVTDCSADFHVPILADDWLEGNAYFSTHIAKASTIAPVVVDTTDRVVERLERKEVLGVVNVEIYACTDAVVHEVTLNTYVELRGGFPLDVVVSDVRELQTCCTVIVFHSGKAGASSVVRNVVVTAHVEACVDAEVIDSIGFREPLFVREHPCCLNAWEDSPTSAEHLQTLVLTKAAVCFSQE